MPKTTMSSLEEELKAERKRVDALLSAVCDCGSYQSFRGTLLKWMSAGETPENGDDES